MTDRISKLITIEFLNSAPRPILVLCELLEPEERLNENNVKNTIVFFGSARPKPSTVARQNNFLKNFQNLKNILKNKWLNYQNLKE